MCTFQAVSTAAAFGDRICIQSKGKVSVEISSQYIASCDTNNEGCNGGYMDVVHEFLKSGVITGGDFDSDIVSELLLNNTYCKQLLQNLKACLYYHNQYLQVYFIAYERFTKSNEAFSVSC